jgi:hypothetical protein
MSVDNDLPFIKACVVEEGPTDPKRVAVLIHAQISPVLSEKLTDRNGGSDAAVYE